MRRIFAASIIFCLAFSVFLTGPDAADAYGWGYAKNKEHRIPEIGNYKEMLEKYGAYYVDGSGQKNVYLTFDNGYEQGYTGDILDVLKKESVPATFFVTGHYVEEEPELLNRMVNEGHIIGNHSYHHPDFSVMNKESIKKELEMLEAAVAEVTEQKEIKYLRPPRGIFNEHTLQWSNELGLIHVFWSLAFNDWNIDAQKGWKYAYDQIMEQIHPGAIVLLHSVSSDNAQALEKVIKDLKKQGYVFKSLDDLLLQSELPEGMLNL